MSMTKTNSIPTPESVHDAWLSQRAELERDLFDGWAPEVRAAPSIARPQVVVNPPDRATVRVSEGDLRSSDASGIRHEPAVEQVETDKARQTEKLKLSNTVAEQQRVEHQQRITESMFQQREVDSQELARQRAAFAQELSARETAWTTQRDQEWAALRRAKEVQDVQEVALQQLKDESSKQQVREREELLQWRRQAEAELAEARRLFEHERLKQQHEFARQREVELAQLRREREEFDSRVRQVQSELAYARQRQEDVLRQARDVQAAQLRAERVELDKLRDNWVEKFRREQVVLENSVQFFGQHLSRVSEELSAAQRGSLAASANEAHAAGMIAEPSLNPVSVRPTDPMVLSLDEIRERLNEIRKPQRAAA